MMWTAAILACFSGSAWGQRQGGSVGTPSTQGGQTIPSITQTTGAGTTATASPTTTDSGGGGGSLGIPGASDSITGGLESQQQFQLAQIKLKPSLTNTNNTAIATSNRFRNSFGAVYYQGSDPALVPNRIPGSFGTALYPATGAAGGRGAQGTAGRVGTGGTITDAGGQIVPLPRQIAYTSQIQFKTPAGNALPQLQTDLRTSIDRVPTDMLANPAGVQVNVDGRNVTLKGNVKDDEESRLVEGLVRLTPGVFNIKNELTIAK